jgi:glycosyltransferase involved in cell wall biosynthesis
MKIAFLNLYSGINQRGAESFTHKLANRLMEKHKVIFFQGGDKLPNQKYKVKKIQNSIRQPEEIFPQRFIKKLFKYLFLDQGNISVLLFTLKSIPELIKQNCDVILPLNGFWQVLILKIIQPFYKFKIIITGHSGPGWDERWNLYLMPNVFIATTKPAFEWAKSACFWTRIELIPYGIDIKSFRDVKEADIKLEKPIILCPSALVPYKRVNLAIRATAELKSASLLVLGEGRLREKIKDLGKKLLAARFLLTSVPYSEVASYYKAADIVTLPSAPQENSPMVFLESLAGGKIVVTTDTVRNRWLLEKAGFYCNPQDIDAYSQTLAFALKEKSSTATKKYFRKARAKFDWDKVLKQYLGILDSLIS